MSFYCTNQVLCWLQKAAAPLLLLVTAVVAAGASSSMFAPGGQLFAFIALVAIAYSTGLVVEHVFRGPALLGQMVEMGYGVAKGIPTLVLAAASFDDVLSISGFGVALGIGLSTGDSTAWVAARGPVELLTGAVYGGVAGVVLGRYLLRHGCVSPVMCTAAGLSVAAMGLLGGKAVGFSGGGAFAVIVLGLCLQLEWNNAERSAAHDKANNMALAVTPATDPEAPSSTGQAPLPARHTQQGREESGETHPDEAEASKDTAVASDATRHEQPVDAAVPSEPSQSGAFHRPAHPNAEVVIQLWRAEVNAHLKQVWAVAQPVLFASVGAAVDLSAVEGRYVGYAALVVTLGVILRCCVTYGVLACESFLTARERLFVTLSWLPKATVQAAIGSLALDAARSQGAGAVAERAGLILLTVAVMSIMLTAPVGALAIAVGGPKLLSADSDSSPRGGAGGGASPQRDVLVSQAAASDAETPTAATVDGADDGGGSAASVQVEMV